MSTNPQLAVRILTGTMAGRVVKLGERAFVGRENFCEIQLQDPGIAPTHARINLRAGSYTLVDLGDASDVKVNQHPVKSRRLALHDKITVGPVQLEVVDFDEVAPPEPVPPPPEAPVKMAAEYASRTAEMEDLAAKELQEVPPPPRALPPPVQRKTGTFVSPERKTGTFAPPVRKTGTYASPERKTGRYPPVDRAASHRAEPTIVVQSRTKDRTPVIVLVSVIVVVLAVAIGFVVVNRKADRDRVNARYREAAQYAAAHPEEYAAIIQRYREVQKAAAGIRDDLRASLEAEISRVESRHAERERDFEAALRSLDRRVKELSDSGEYADALKVYEGVADPAIRGRVLEVRRADIQELKKKAEKATSEQKELLVKKDAEQKAQQDTAAQEDLKKGAGEAVDLLIAGDADGALKTLERLGADERYAPVKDRISEAMVSVRAQRSADQTLAASFKPAEGEKPAAPVPGPDAAEFLEKAPAEVKVVYAIRGGDLLTAQAQAGQLAGHLFREPFLARSQMSQEQKVENEAAQKLTAIWRQAVQDPAARLPPPADATAQFQKMARERVREDVLKLCAEFQKCRDAHGKTKVIREFADLFKAVDEVPGIVQVKASRLSGLGDGRIIQADGDTFYVEANAALKDPQDLSIGLCKEDVAFYGADTNRAVAAWVDVYSVLPFKVLSEKQLAFSMLAGQRKQSPAVGDVVLIGRNIQTGRRFMAGIARQEPVLVFSSDFEKRVEQEWRSPSPSMAVDVGKLTVDSGSDGNKQRNPNEGDLELNLDLGSGAAGLEADVIRKADNALRIVLGQLEFVIGEHEGRKAGIYSGGKLVKPGDFPRPVVGTAQRIGIVKSRTYARVDVGKASVECRVSPPAGESEVRKILFFNSGRFSVDNVKVRKLPGTGEAKVLGVGADRKEVLLSKGTEAEWDAIAIDHPVYFFSGRPNETNVIAEARIREIMDSWVIGSTGRGNVLNTACLVSLVDAYPQADAPVEVMADTVKQRKQSSDILYGLPKTGGPAGTCVLDTPGYVAEKGLVYPVTERHTNPETGELLAVMPGEGVRCDFKQDGGMVTGLPADGAALEIPASGALFARNALVAGRRVDLPVYTMSFVPASGTKKDLWKETSGDWKEKPGRLSGSPTAAGGPAVATLTESMGDCVQCDLDVRVEKEGKQSDEDWMRDVMIEAFFPGKQAGVAFGVGVGSTGGMIVQGHTITQDKGPEALKWPGPLPATVTARTGEWEKGSPSLDVGQSYAFRIRRVKDTVAFYINGKRLATVRTPDLDGDMQLRVAGAECAISLGRVTITELSRSCRIPEQEPPLGEFGYVIQAEGTHLLADADMSGAAVGKKVSVMAVDKVVQGEKSKTVLLRRVAVGTITDVGPRTVKITCSDATENLAKGMKVLPGSLPAQVTFSDSRIRDIGLGL